LLQIGSRIQTREEKIEEEVVRAKLDMRTVLATTIKELRVEFDSRIALCGFMTIDFQENQQLKVNNRIKKFDDSVADIN